MPPHFSRRALLAGSTGLAAAPLLAWVARERLPLLTHSRGVPGAFLNSLIERLEARFAEAGRPVRVEPRVATQHRDLVRLAQGCTGDALLFAGAGWAQAWRQALPSAARPVQMSLGAELDPTHVSASTWQALELGGQWSARTLGPRAGVLVAVDQAASDLPLAFEHGLERAGGRVVRRVVALPGRAADAWAALAGGHLDVVAVLASGEQAAALWSHAPQGLATLTHAWSGGEGRSHVVHEAGSALDTLATRVVAQLQGRSLPPSLLHLTTPTGLVTSLGPADSATLANQAHLSLRNRSAFPFTGC
ncbi:MAG: hypothetical protein Q8K32_33230 [Archangium sp.]|nr:hypothetical protein [Archangium sp.]MDP3573204.1 hypothetical protein [Archangium sp.]